MKLRWFVMLLLVLTVAACGHDRNPRAGSAGAVRPQVVASFYPVDEAARRVGGDRVTVLNLTPAGAEPHDLELSPKQVDLIEGAELVLYLGHGFQPGVEKVAGRTKGKAVDLLDGLPLTAAADEEGKPSSDPHVWLDPVLMEQVVGQVERALASVDPRGQAAYAANAAAYRADLIRLDGEYRRGLEHCQRRVIVTSHAAFGYLAKRYGLEQVAVAGLSPESEPDPKRLGEIADLVRRSGSTTVFTETLVSPKIADTLAREAGVRTAVLDPIEGLTPDEVKAGKTYLSVMEDNLHALQAALGCG
jgi:zinc transport system substrate-binding protein